MMESKRGCSDEQDDHHVALLSTLLESCSHLPLNDPRKTLNDALGALHRHRTAATSRSNATSLLCVSGCYASLGQYYEALRFALEALQLRRRTDTTLPNERCACSAEIVASIIAVSHCFGCLGDWEEAVHYAKEALVELAPNSSIGEHQDGVPRAKMHRNDDDDDDDVNASLMNVDCYSKALNDLVKPLLFDESGFRDGAACTGLAVGATRTMALANVSNRLLDLGNHTDALRIARHALQLQQRHHQMDGCVAVAAQLPPPTASSLSGGDAVITTTYDRFLVPTLQRLVGSILCSMGNHQTGLEYALESLESVVGVLDHIDPASPSTRALPHHRHILAEVAASVDAVGNCYDGLGDRRTALKYAEAALLLRHRALPANHPDVSASLNNVACCNANLGDVEGALQNVLEAIRLQSVLPECHPNAAICLENAGRCYQFLESDEATSFEYFRRASELRQKLLPPGHPDAPSSPGGKLNSVSHHARLRVVNMRRILREFLL